MFKHAAQRALAAARLAAGFVHRAVDLRDVFVFGGLACAVYGIAQLHGPAAWIAAGAAFFWLGVRR